MLSVFWHIALMVGRLMNIKLLVEWGFQGKWKYSEKTCPSATLSTINLTWPDLGLNLGHKEASTLAGINLILDIWILVFRLPTVALQRNLLNQLHWKFLNHPFMFSIKYFIHNQRVGGDIRCTEKGHMTLSTACHVWEQTGLQTGLTPIFKSWNFRIKCLTYWS
jgi:hypothetical protein